ncbi:MAG: NADH:ubiquinone reductase (Na(+)-transporting) subunit A [Flavobacteriales bacterium]|nr:NADH:ubiquinone reductase (Na(+)-transporting) subunit A [Flavobacteriales bacterium]
MSKDIRIKKGVNIKLKGSAERVYANIPSSKLFFIKPSDFIGLNPKLTVKVGDKVLAGSPLFFDKENPSVIITSPVSGDVFEIRRGKKRKILSVIINADEEISYKNFPKAKADEISREDIISQILEAGLWPFVRQRPFAVIANPKDKPKSIFISAFDSAPLSCDNDFILHGMEKEFQNGLDIVSKLTEGTTHLNIDGNVNSSSVFTSAKGVQINNITGPHPSGNVGIQIHHIDPLNKGEIVWYMYPQDIVAIGRLFSNGKYDASRLVALAGSQVKKPRYYRTMQGALISQMIKENIKEGNNRFISGNVLTGNQISAEDSLGFYHNEICVIPEGNRSDFLGWLLPGFHKFSLSRTFFSWLNPKKEFDISANMNGEERAYVVTGQYENVLPMDIYPQHLIKSIMVGDIELMENLGIYEVAEEDFALCEFSCTSKIPVQEILREGMDLVKKECS